MATSKLFNVVGISKLNGSYKVRFATDIMRVKVLEKHGHEDIRLVELDEAVTKYEAVKSIVTSEMFSDVAAQAAIAEYLDEHAPKGIKSAVLNPEAAAEALAEAITEGANEDAPF